MRRFFRGSVPKPKDFSPLGEVPEVLDLEIGCGVGLHPIRWAQAHPERTIIAIERTREKAGKFFGRLSHHPSLRNVKAIHGCGVAWTAHLLPPESVDRIFLLYPNPQFKERNLRWHQMPAMALLREVMKPGGRLTLATNEEWYFREAREWLEAHWGFRVEEAAQLSPSAAPRTHFEKKYLFRGETCWNLEVSKPS